MIKIEQLSKYFKYTHNNSLLILNAHLGTSMMLLEQEKMRQTVGIQ
jgi:hypothetical protein